MKTIEEVATWLDGLNFSGWATQEGDYNGWLDARDSPPFDIEWMCAFSLMGDLEIDEPLEEADNQRLKQLREAAYSKAVQATSNAELAAYVADDVDFLARAARVGLGDGWLITLQHTYETGQFPRGSLGLS